MILAGFAGLSYAARRRTQSGRSRDLRVSDPSEADRRRVNP